MEHEEVTAQKANVAQTLSFDNKDEIWRIAHDFRLTLFSVTFISSNIKLKRFKWGFFKFLSV